jgi:hypothetical protein
MVDRADKININDIIIVGGCTFEVEYPDPKNGLIKIKGVTQSSLVEGSTI